jgi:trimethylamine--corrinoid protein Co-methyltransferase
MRISLLDRAQLQQLHEASIFILEKIGVHLPHDEALRLFAAAGAEVDFADQHVRIPEKVVHECLALAGKQFTIYGRDRSRSAEFGLGRRNYNSSAGQALWVDDNGRRYPTLDDVRTAARLADALPRINIVGAMADPHELPVESRAVVVAAELLKQTTKPITFWFHDRASARFLLELFTIVSGSEAEAMEYPLAYPFLEPISPLRFPRRGVDLLFETCRFKLPVPIGPMAQMGATAVATLAGTIAQQNAEILAGMCIVQLIGPGTPVCYGGVSHAFDMRTTQVIFGGPEQALMGVALTEMARFYQLPVYINVGLTDSKLPDAQAGLESGVTLACGAMAGADIFGHLGICGADQGASLAMLVLQHEAIGYVDRLLQGIEINDDSLGLDVIAEGIRAGSFLGLEHTRDHFRRELWFPRLFDRRYWEAWNADGRTDTASRCNAEKERILREHQPAAMSREQERDVDRLIDDAQRHLLTPFKQEENHATESIHIAS